MFKFSIDKRIFKTLSFKQKFTALWGCFLANVGYLKP